MASEVGGEQRCGTGARLRDAREKQGLTLAQAAASLHLDPSTLEALEAEDFAALGADVYVRGHLRRYAELIGESPAQLQELYARSVPAAHPDLTRIPHREPGRGAARLVRGSLQGSRSRPLRCQPPAPPRRRRARAPPRRRRARAPPLSRRRARRSWG